MGAVLIVGVVGGLGHLAGVLKTALGRGDAGQESPGVVALGVDLRKLHGGFDGVGLVVLIVDGEVTIEADAFTVASQDAGAYGVEGAHGHRFSGSQHQAVQAFAHFARGLVGEGDGKYAPGSHSALFDEVGDAVGDDAGLAGAGSRDDQQGSVCTQHGLLLGFVQALEDGG